MLRTKNAPLRWTPVTDVDRKRVQQELDAILASHHFRNSKRYPSLLRYVVEKTLNGESDYLKERTLGVEVFERRPDYDTNTDPVVRFSASEVRRRLAQYYHETQETSSLQIELPLGSYIPDFRVASPSHEPVEALDHPVPANPPERPEHGVTSRQPEGASLPPEFAADRLRQQPVRPWIQVVAVFVTLVLVLCVFAKHSRPETKMQLWNPLLRTSGPIVFVVGSGSLELTTPEPVTTSLFDHMIGPYHHISIASALTISRLAGTIEVQKKQYFVKEAPATSLVDIRERSVVVVEALNNAWALRLIEPLRFRFVHGPMARIEDRQNPQNVDWTVDFSQPYSGVSKDYGIVARYHDSLTNGDVMIVAGLGPYGTQAAGELVTSEAYLAQATRNLPPGWQNKNVELVIRTNVIDGEAGPPQVVAQTVW